MRSSSTWTYVTGYFRLLHYGPFRGTEACDIGTNCIKVSVSLTAWCCSCFILKAAYVSLVCERNARVHGLNYIVNVTESLVFKTGRGSYRVPKVILSSFPGWVVRRFKYLDHMTPDDMRDDEDIKWGRRVLVMRRNGSEFKFTLLHL